MKINRLFEIVYILLEKGRVTSKYLADKFCVSQRTIYRDIDILSLSGVPVVMYKGKSGGVCLLSEFHMGNAILDDNEKRQILSSLNIAGSILPENNGGALTKLRAVFGQTEPDWIEIDFDDWTNENHRKELFFQIRSSIQNKTQVQFDYYSANGNTSREIQPLKLCFKGQAWYVYAYCLLKKQYRFFKINRIRNLVDTKTVFDRKSDFNVLKSFSGYNDNFIKAKFKIDKKMAYRVYDEFSDIQLLQNGDFIVCCTVPTGEWLLNYVSSLGEHCEVLEPESLRDDIINRFKGSLANYK